MAIDKSKIDVSAVFLCYMATIGDAERTAAAYDLTPAQVAELAESEGWSEKIRRVSVMSKSEKPGDWERAQNRALCFVQAYQIRQLINRWIKHFTDADIEDLLSRTGTTDKLGKEHYSAKIVSDLCAAAEACHRMSYAALGDTVTERLDRKDKSGDNPTAGDMHSAVIAMLNSHHNVPVGNDLLLDEQKSAIPTQPSEPEASAQPGKNGP